MSDKRTQNGRSHNWVELSDSIKTGCPQLVAWYNTTDDFQELRFKARDDGTILAIAKGYGADGGPIVCFGVGYDVPAACLAINASIAGGHWRVDKPWDARK